MIRDAKKMIVAVVISCLLYGCGDHRHQTDEFDGYEETAPCLTFLDDDSDAKLDSSVILPIQLSDLRQPDIKKRVRKGSALLLETSGLQLAAVDTAVLHAGEYSVTSLTEEELAPLPQGMRNMTYAAAGYRLLPGGEHFSPYAELRVAYDPERLPTGYTPEDIYTSYYDTAVKAWVRLERLSVDTVNREIVSATTHFTDFINELLKAPEMPETQAFVPTQMSSLEAANPLSEYTTIAPPEANNMGTANLTYPFQVPVGRGGMQPSLALNYNSNGGNGVCGMGWDFSVPCISIETRWGVPLYNKDLETETYLLNGEQLLVSYDSLPTFARQYNYRQSNDYTKRFYPRVEGAFDSILRHGCTPQTYWWEVYDRSGTRYIYGLGDGELRSQQRENNFEEYAIAKWYLTRVIDRNGNTTRYHYRTYEGGGIGKLSGRAIYLDRITYTAPNKGFPDQPWYGYCVTLHYCPGRMDPIISGNLGVKENICWRLDSVKTWYVKNMPAPKLNGDSLMQHDPKPGYSSDKSTLDKLIFENHEEVDVDEMATWLYNRDTVHSSNKSMIRGYRLLYSYSVTGKSLLSAVVEMSSDEWDRHAKTIQPENLCDTSKYKYYLFNYKTIDTVYKEAVCITPFEEIMPGLQHGLFTSPLGGSNNKSVSGGISVGVGLGLKFWLRTLNIEGSGSWGKTWSDGLVTLVDLNGDGYPDRLWQKYLSTDRWKYQLFNPQTGQLGVVNELSLQAKTFSYTESRSRNFGAGVHVGIDTEVNANINLGYQHTHSDSETKTYLSDVNADGLIDIVKGSVVYYNKSTNTQIVFSDDYTEYVAPEPSCSNGYYSLDGSVAVDSTLSDIGTTSVTSVSGYVDPQELHFEDFSNRNTLEPSFTDTIKHSIVKVWMAPYDGDISVSGRAVLDSRFAERRRRHHSDGVRLSIQKNAQVCDSVYLSVDDSAHNFERGIESVQRGDRLYFRVEAREETGYDIVNWEPEIEYTDNTLSGYDTEDRLRRRFSSRQDFLSWQDEQFIMPATGAVRVIAPVTIGEEFSDTVKLGIYITDSLGNITPTGFRHVVNPAATAIIPFDSILPLDEGKGLLFLAESPHDVDWTKLGWTPHVVSHSFVDTAIVPRSIINHGDSVRQDTVYSIDVRLGVADTTRRTTGIEQVQPFLMG